MTGLGCSGSKEWDRQESILKSLIKRQATREVVITALGSDYNDYSQGSTNREGLLLSLRNEPTNRLVKVRANIDKWPNLLFYSTPDVMTWVFLNNSNRVVDYALSAQ